MGSSKLASRYAKSIMELAKTQDKVEKVLADMALIRKLMRNHEFAAVMRSPVVKSDKKQSILKALLTGKVEDITISFLTLLTAKHREANLIEIADAFVDQYNELNGIVPVILTTAEELDDESIGLIEDMLKSKARLDNVQLDKKIRPDLLGGFTLNYQNKLLDASVRHQLQLLANSVKNKVLA